MDDQDSALLTEPRVLFPGPFEYHDVVVDGWSVPLIKAHPRGEDRVRLILDGRIGIELSANEAERVLPFLADVVAVALGYGAHPDSTMRALPPRAPRDAPRPTTQILPPPAN